MNLFFLFWNVQHESCGKYTYFPLLPDTSANSSVKTYKPLWLMFTYNYACLNLKNTGKDSKQENTLLCSFLQLEKGRWESKRCYHVMLQWWINMLWMILSGKDAVSLHTAGWLDYSQDFFATLSHDVACQLSEIK